MTTETVKTSIFRIPGVLPVYSVFFFEAFVLGNWIPRIPDVKELFGFSASQVGAVLFCISFGTLFAFLMGSVLTKKLGLRLGCAIAGPAWACMIALIPFMPSGFVLGPLAFVAGFFIGILEISMNSAADRLERSSGRRLMSKAHGFWSLGSLVGALVGTKVATLGIDLQTHFASVLGLSAFCSLIVGLMVPVFQQTERSTEAATFKLPSRSIILLCMMPIGIMLVEGAFIDWSALFVKEVLDGGALAIGSIFAAFAAVMTITRLSGDTLLDLYGPRRVAKVSAICATLGIALFCLAPNVPLAFVGALLSGVGVAIFYPLTMTAAANRPGDQEDNVAAMSLFAFTSFMFAPPIIGFLADQIGLRWSLALLIPIAASSLLLLGELEKSDE